MKIGSSAERPFYRRRFQTVQVAKVIQGHRQTTYDFPMDFRYNYMYIYIRDGTAVEQWRLHVTVPRWIAIKATVKVHSHRMQSINQSTDKRKHACMTSISTRISRRDMI